MARKKNKTTKVATTKDKGPQYSLTRYVLTGAGLGLYFGLFFQPVREPYLFTPLLLGSAGALVMTLLALRRPEARKPRALARYALGAWLGLTLALLVLEGRHPIYNVAGKAGVTLFTTAAGAAAGAWYARRAAEQAP